MGDVRGWDRRHRDLGRASPPATSACAARISSASRTIPKSSSPAASRSPPRHDIQGW